MRWERPNPAAPKVKVEEMDGAGTYPAALISRSQLVPKFFLWSSEPGQTHLKLQICHKSELACPRQVLQRAREERKKNILYPAETLKCFPRTEGNC